MAYYSFLNEFLTVGKLSKTIFLAEKNFRLEMLNFLPDKTLINLPTIR